MQAYPDWRVLERVQVELNRERSREIERRYGPFPDWFLRSARPDELPADEKAEHVEAEAHPREKIAEDGAGGIAPPSSEGA